MDWRKSGNLGSGVDTEIGSFCSLEDLYRYMLEEGIDKVEGKITFWGSATEFNFSIEELKEFIETTNKALEDMLSKISGGA